MDTCKYFFCKSEIEVIKNNSEVTEDSKINYKQFYNYHDSGISVKTFISSEVNKEIVIDIVHLFYIDLISFNPPNELIRNKVDKLMLNLRFPVFDFIKIDLLKIGLDLKDIGLKNCKVLTFDCKFKNHVESNSRLREIDTNSSKFTSFSY